MPSKSLHLDDVDIDTLEGRVIDGRYELLERIGEGAMGAVYRAHQRVVDRLVAVKFLHGEIADEEDFRARFEREARALGRFDHPGCVRVYDFGWFAEIGAPFLVSEFVEGETLYERLGTPMTPLERIGYARDIADAMAHAHDHEILHRDLKPENVLVTSSGRVKVVDFGLARMTSADEEIRLTQEGQAHGTPAYMSPEQCRGDTNLTPTCDVYSLGCMLFELFEGRIPFSAPTTSGVLIKHVTDPVPKQTNAATPPAVRDLIIAMMQKVAAERPSMTAVTEVLDAVIAELSREEEVSQPRVMTREISPPLAPRKAHPENEEALRVTSGLQEDEVELRPRRRLVVPVAIAGALVLALFIVMLAGLSNDDPSAVDAVSAGDSAQPAVAIDEASAPVEEAVVEAPATEPVHIEDAKTGATPQLMVELPVASPGAEPVVQPAALEPEPKPAKATARNTPQAVAEPAATPPDAGAGEAERERRRRSVKLRY